MSEMLSLNLDLVIFAFITLIATAIVSLLIRRNLRTSALPRRMSGVVLILMIATIYYASHAGERERARLVEMVAGIAPTYATVLHNNGLEKITVNTPHDDPTYLHLIELEKQLLNKNKSVADVYTLLRRPDGMSVLIVDSETDYNHNGAIDEEREQRTEIGEAYDEPDFVHAMDTALAGQPVFMSEISSDRWGSWVSAVEPVFDANGKVYAVVGVDFPADRWVRSILSVRGTHLIIGLVVNAIVLVAAFMISRLQAEVGRRKSAEVLAKASENRLRLIVDNEPECVAVFDASGRILEINPAGTTLLGVSGVAPIGRSLQEFVTEDRRASLVTQLADVFNGTSAAFELCVESPTTPGRQHWLDAHCVPLRDSFSNVISLLLVGRDVTERRQAEAEKQELQRQLIDASRQAGMAEIATGVLHNVGNVLNSVNVSVGLVSQRVREMRLPSFAKLLDLIRSQKDQFGSFVSNDPRGKCLPDFLEQLYKCFDDDQKLISNELTQLVSGIDHIKEVVRMQQSCASGPSTVLMPIDPTSIMEDAIKVNMVSMEKHRVHLKREYEPCLPVLPLDKHKVLQILINLIANAKGATCDPSVADRHITVSVGRIGDGKTLEFRVSDNGVGIEPANFPKLFRHGFTTREDGHGFGLHSSANAATEMRGSLRGESDGPGTGATFILTLPVSFAHLEVAA